MARRSLFAIILLVISGCSTSGNKAKLTIGDPLYRDEYEVYGQSISKKSFEPNDKVAYSGKRTLSTAELANFWSTIDDASVFDWLPIYRMSKSDGRSATMDWLLTVSKDGRTMQSDGGGAFPGESNPKEPVMFNPSLRFQKVYRAFSNLSPTK